MIVLVIIVKVYASLCLIQGTEVTTSSPNFGSVIFISPIRQIQVVTRPGWVTEIKIWKNFHCSAHGLKALRIHKTL